MEQTGGCCIARYAGGAYDISKIMLRFRPIAPKPPSSAAAAATPENSCPSLKRGRGKKRCVSKRNNNSNNNNNSKKRKSSPENTDSGGSVTGGEKEIRTLPLLPEAPDVKESPKKSYPMWLSFENGGRTVAPAAAAVVVGSWVRVECVTDAWLMDSYLNGVGRSTDDERVRSLDVDTCPGFISDGFNKVRWMNAAYRRMVAGKGAVSEVAAWVVVEDGVALPVGCAAFTCRVRVVTCGKETTNSKTVPCDVWKMECGGFAWRLDTTAALSLCIGN